MSTRFALPDARRTWACLLEQDGQHCWERIPRRNGHPITAPMDPTTTRTQDPCPSLPHHRIPS